MYMVCGSMYVVCGSLCVVCGSLYMVCDNLKVFCGNRSETIIIICDHMYVMMWYMVVFLCQYVV